jgi:asparagine synthetase B (glutamine-hydrolysing)
MPPHPNDFKGMVLMVIRFGIKPLFWTVAKGRLLVAAEMKAFKPLNVSTLNGTCEVLQTVLTILAIVRHSRTLKRRDSFCLEI